MVVPTGKKKLRKHQKKALDDVLFAEAVETDLLTDYKVLVLAVDQQYVADNFQQAMAESGEIKIDEAAKRDVWRKSNRSGPDSACVEVRYRGEAVDVRDSKDRNGPVLTFTSSAWAAFLAAIRSDDLHNDRH